MGALLLFNHPADAGLRSSDWSCCRVTRLAWLRCCARLGRGATRAFQRSPSTSSSAANFCQLCDRFFVTPKL